MLFLPRLRNLKVAIPFSLVRDQMIYRFALYRYICIAMSCIRLYVSIRLSSKMSPLIALVEDKVPSTTPEKWVRDHVLKRNRYEDSWRKNTDMIKSYTNSEERRGYTERAFASRETARLEWLLAKKRNAEKLFLYDLSISPSPKKCTCIPLPLEDSPMRPRNIVARDVL